MINSFNLESHQKSKTQREYETNKKWLKIGSRKDNYIVSLRSLHLDPQHRLVNSAAKTEIYHPIICKNNKKFTMMIQIPFSHSKLQKIGCSVLEEEPFKKGIAFHAGEEERLSRRIGSRVIQHR